MVMPGAARSHQEVAAEVHRAFPDLDGENAVTQQAAALLARYFAGERVDFDLPVDERGFTPFQREVYGAVAHIGYGAVKSYAEVAREIGRPRAARGVGSAMARNPLPIIIPCHRVVGSGGALIGYSAPGGVATKRALLRMEAAGPGAERRTESTGDGRESQ